MRLLTANDIEDEDDDENEHDRRIEEHRSKWGQRSKRGTGQILGFLAKGLPNHRPRTKLSSPDRSALGFYLTCLQSSLTTI